VPPREFPIGRDEDGSRLETFLRRRLGLARGVAQKALRKGWVRVDGKRSKPETRLAPGQVVRITNNGLPLPGVDGEGVASDAASQAPARPVPPDEVARARASVRHADPAFLVANKPCGVAVHAGSGHAWGAIDALAHALGEPPPVPIGRIDRDTSGLLVLARTRGAARRMFDGLKTGTLARTYTALVLGRLTPDAGTIDLPLERVKRGPAGRERMEPADDGLPARSLWRVLDRRREATLVLLELDTGRTHQLRAHLAATGHPILGDPRYGDDAARALARRLELQRLFLHAGRLVLRHPDDDRPLAFDEPLPPELEAVLAKLGG
jgi:23S rRNA pseudouridine955/2504/2580 synthase